MRREHLDHLIRAAAEHAGVDELIVFGSQSILGTFSEQDLPIEATRSVEADICSVRDDDGERADHIDGAIGEDSQFHAEFGYYAQGAQMDFVRLPDGWWHRRTSSQVPGLGSKFITANFIEPHDLAISKLIASREKDIDFCHALVAAGLLDPDLLLERLDLVPDLTGAERARGRTGIRIISSRPR